MAEAANIIEAALVSTGHGRLTSLTHDNNATHFAELLQPVYGQLQVFCRRSVQCPEDAADVLQAALATAYSHFDQFQQGSNFRAWIFRYVTFEILNANRARLREPLQLDTEVIVDQQTQRACLATWPELPDFSSMLGEWFDDSVRCAVLELTENERSILLLRAIGEFRYREISEILGFPEGTVMGLLSRARQKLRIALSEYALQNGFNRKETST